MISALRPTPFTKLLVSLFAIAIAGGAAYGTCTTPPGDVTGNGNTDIVDVQCSILTALWELGGANPATIPTCIGGAPERADASCNGTVNVVDVQITIQTVLGQPLDPAIDVDGDHCVDACTPQPVCSNGACESGEDCASCPADCGPCTGICCEPSAIGGCADGPCEACVCAIDAFCCDVQWDSLCVSAAQSACSLDCGCAPTGSCCAAHESPGCELTECSACACTYDPFCCQSAWDDTCVSIATAFCTVTVSQVTTATGSRVVPPVTTLASATVEAELLGGQALVIALSHTASGATGLFLRKGAPGQNGPAIADLGVPAPQMTAIVNLGPAEVSSLLAGETYLVLTTTVHPAGELRANLALATGAGPCPCGSLLDCCEPHGFLGCGTDPCADCVCALDSFCCAVGWDLSCAANAAGSCDAACACSLAEPCCLPHDGPGCQSQGCEDCVCQLDAFCCEGVWDAFCVQLGQEECLAACGCPAPSGDECCSALPTTGCGGTPCEDCVCGDDPFCCAFSWDDSCAVVAASTCQAACGCPPLATGSCCAPSPNPGCANPTCQACVCGADSWCCDVMWDETCVSIALGACAASCPCSP